MTVRIGVNGFGRIGRYLTRLLAGGNGIEIAAINARAENKDLARLLKYDSVHRTFPGQVGFDEQGLVVEGRKITVTRDEPGAWRWGELGVDVVIESTGKFTERSQAARHLDCGAKKVIISAPGKNADATLVMGVNHDSYDPKRHSVVSAASCTTNCLAPAAKTLNQAFGLKRGLMTTIHSYTMSQRILDGTHKDPRRARATALSIIPTSTGAARALALVIPELAGKLDGMAVRVPTPNVSLVDLTCELEREAGAKDINDVLECASGEIMGYSDEPLVSVDYLGSSQSGIVDGLCTSIIDGRLAKVVLWYDNESGFSNQLVRLTRLVSESVA